MFEQNPEILWILVSILIVVLLSALVFWLRTSSKSLEQPKEEAQSELPGTAKRPEAPIPSKKPSFGAALKTWVPLLREKTKDKSRWEEVLIMSDMGPKLADELLTGLEDSQEEPLEFFRGSLKNILRPAKASGEPWREKKPWICYIVGVNGVGKTTSIVKLSHLFKTQGLEVGVVGADTFRKAAIEQLERGCLKAGVDFFSKKMPEESEGADPSSVIFDGLKAFQTKDVILVDTSGRLHTKKNLMDELQKMKRVGAKAVEGAPHDIWLVLDATLGQNALSQAMSFHQAMSLTGLVLTKMDGLSRGGSVFQLFRELQTPIWFIGKGESLEDLESFHPEQFVDELFDLEAS